MPRPSYVFQHAWENQPGRFGDVMMTYLPPFIPTVAEMVADTSSLHHQINQTFLFFSWELKNMGRPGHEVNIYTLFHLACSLLCMCVCVCVHVCGAWVKSAKFSVSYIATFYWPCRKNLAMNIHIYICTNQLKPARVRNSKKKYTKIMWNGTASYLTHVTGKHTLDSFC